MCRQEESLGIVSNSRLMIKICEMYYMQNLSQKEISSRLSVSRPQISRILAQARAEGIVNIKINNPHRNESELEQTLIRCYSLRDALVIDNGGENASDRMERFAAEAAGQLDSYLPGGSAVGVMSGNTVKSVVEAMPFTKKKLQSVVSLVGGIGAGSVDLHANSSAQRLASKYNTSAFSLNAPALASDPVAAEMFRREPSVAKVLDMGSRCDIALVGIGSVCMEATNIRVGALTEVDLSYLRERGAQASICCSYVNAQGGNVGEELVTRSIGQSLDSLRKVKIIAMAFGDSKVEAIRAALNTGRVHVLITDLATAEKIVRLP